jgi:hypothetical protein
MPIGTSRKLRCQVAPMARPKEHAVTPIEFRILLSADTHDWEQHATED